MDRNGEGTTSVTTGEQADFHPSWLPDGSGIVFDSDRDHAPGVEITNRELHVMDSQGGHVERLTEYSD